MTDAAQGGWTFGLVASRRDRCCTGNITVNQLQRFGTFCTFDGIFTCLLGKRRCGCGQKCTITVLANIYKRYKQSLTGSRHGNQEQDKRKTLPLCSWKGGSTGMQSCCWCPETRRNDSFPSRRTNRACMTAAATTTAAAAANGTVGRPHGLPCANSKDNRWECALVFWCALSLVGLVGHRKAWKQKLVGPFI
jgi:hypothetical protein